MKPCQESKLRKGKIFKVGKFLLIFILIFGWIFSGWPQIWQNPPIPPRIGQALASPGEIKILPNSKKSTDNTGEEISEITTDNATLDPDTVTAVAAGDGIYTVDKGKIMHFENFDVSQIPVNSTISGAVLHLQYGAEDGYAPTTAFVRYANPTTLTNTTINPTDINDWSPDLTYDLYAQGVDTVSELRELDIEFTSSDALGADAVNFDYLWIIVTYTPPSPILTVNTTGTQVANMNIGTTENYVGGAFTFLEDAGKSYIESAVLPTGRDGLACAENSSTNKIYCFGGFDGGYVSQIVEYNPSTDSLVAKSAVLPAGRNGLACAENSSTNKIYCFGGNDSGGRVSQIVEYNPSTDSSILVTQVIITESPGTVNANQNLSNVDVRYETADTCIYNGTETLFGTGASFNASEKATVSGTMELDGSQRQMCIYIILDVGSGASAGETLEIQISNPSTEVTVSIGTVFPATAVEIAGTTTLQSANQAPVVEVVDLTPDPITLTENTTTTVYCSPTISDQQGGTDVVSATATIYRSGVGYNCPQDDNNCYPNITPSATSTSGNYFYATFTEDIWFHAEPTDSGTYSGETWQCYVIAEDSGGLTATNTDSIPPELNSLEALIITSTINYGTLAAGATSSVSQQTTVTSTGNIPIDVKLKGIADFTSNGYSFDASQQEYATSSVDYGSGTALATTTYATLELNLPKPTTHPSTSTDIIYWRIAIPQDQQLGTYYSTTSAAATED